MLTPYEYLELYEGMEKYDGNVGQASSGNKLKGRPEFYDKFLINSESKAVRTAINLKTEVVNTVLREEFVYNILIPRVSEFEQKYNLDVRISGMPYVRTKYSETINKLIL